MKIIILLTFLKQKSQIFDFPPTGEITISSSQIKGQTLIADVSDINDPDGMPSKEYIIFKWSNTAVVSTTTSYTLQDDDDGKTITFSLSFKDLADTLHSGHPGIENRLSNLTKEIPIKFLVDVFEIINNENVFLFKMTLKTGLSFASFNLNKLKNNFKIKRTRNSKTRNISIKKIEQESDNILKITLNRKDHIKSDDYKISYTQDANNKINIMEGSESNLLNSFSNVEALNKIKLTLKSAVVENFSSATSKYRINIVVENPFEGVTIIEPELGRFSK